MRWRKKHKEAWALLVTEADALSSIPLYKQPGKKFLEILLEVNLQWNLKLLDELCRETDGRVFLFVSKNNKRHVKKIIKSFGLTSKFRIKIISDGKGHRGLLSIYESLVDDFISVTVWNLESFLIGKMQIMGNRPITGHHGSLLLIKNSEDESSSGAFQPAVLPSFYDLESIRDSIMHLETGNYDQFTERAFVLAEIFRDFMENLPN